MDTRQEKRDSLTFAYARNKRRARFLPSLHRIKPRILQLYAVRNHRDWLFQTELPKVLVLH
jgi:hypothetical protein